MLHYIFCMIISALTAYVTTLIVESIKVKKAIAAVKASSDVEK